MASLPLVSIADPDEPGAVHAYTEVGIGGETLRVVVDTGGGSSIFPAVPGIAELDVVDADPGMGVTATAATDDVVVVPRLSLGSIVRRDVRASRIPVDDDRPPSLGMDVLGQHRCHFRFAAGEVEIDEAIPADVSPFPLTTQPPGQPMVPVRLGAVEAAALWDTGASLTIVDESFVNAHPRLFEITGRTEGLDTSGSHFVCRTATMTGCTIGGVHFGPTPCGIFDLGPLNELVATPVDLGIGMPIMAQADWLFDFPAVTWAITATHGEEATA